MDASIHPYTKSGKRQYYVKWRDADGRQHTKRGFPTKRDAKLFIANLTTGTAAGTWVDPQDGRATVGTLGRAWLAMKRGIVKQTTYDTYETAWRVHVAPRWAARQIGTIRYSEVQSWVSEMAGQSSAKVVTRAYSVLSAICATAVADRLIAANPCEGVQLPRQCPTPRQYLDVPQLLALADAAGDWRPLVLTLGFCGLRIGEARGLRVKDVDFSRGRLHVTRSVSQRGGTFHVSAPKTWETRDVPATAEVLDALRPLLVGRGPDELVFTSPYDGGYIRDAKRHGSWLEGAAKRAGVPPVTAHELRHTAASIAISAGANVKAVQRMLGHKTAAMTLDTYADLFDADLDAVADAMGSQIAAVRTI
ncbi:tyrosine-type recombinase/integrase [Bifidobacterium cuniculi]|uniref:Phage integrase n=1 Tax=Bifidobacterium cuniculi TaxID=1688 RepID=A0A087B2T2_9BIFI|nr:site-specific integrase [Bifidobacterium cuniculi]KFI65332.1 phage integrase [Bifidobacterium cuniculi]